MQLRTLVLFLIVGAITVSHLKFAFMFQALSIVFQGLFILCAVMLLLGLIRPGWALWFLDRSNRLIVIRIFGGLGLVFFLMWQLVELSQQ